MFRFGVNTRPPPLSRPQEVNHVNVPPNAKAASCPTIMRIKCLNIVVNNAGVRLPAWAAAGGDWRSVLNHQTSFGQMHICSQVARCTRWHFTVNLASFLHCCRLDLLPNWFRHLHSRGRGRSLSAFPQLAFIINSNCERARVTQSQATSCPICLATGHAHVPMFLILILFRKRGSPSTAEGDRERVIEREVGVRRTGQPGRAGTAHTELTQLDACREFSRAYYNICLHTVATFSWLSVRLLPLPRARSLPACLAPE